MSIYQTEVRLLAQSLPALQQSMWRIVLDACFSGGASCWRCIFPSHYTESHLADSACCCSTGSAHNIKTFPKCKYLIWSILQVVKYAFPAYQGLIFRVRPDDVTTTSQLYIFIHSLCFQQLCSVYNIEVFWYISDPDFFPPYSDPLQLTWSFSSHYLPASVH